MLGLFYISSMWPVSVLNGFELNIPSGRRSPCLRSGFSAGTRSDCTWSTRKGPRVLAGPGVPDHSLAMALRPRNPASHLGGTHCGSQGLVPAHARDRSTSPHRCAAPTTKCPRVLAGPGVPDHSLAMALRPRNPAPNLGGTHCGSQGLVPAHARDRSTSPHRCAAPIHRWSAC